MSVLIRRFWGQKKRVAGSVLAVLALAAPAAAQQGHGFLVVRTAAGGKIAYETYEELTVNGQSKLRVSPGAAATINDNTYKKLAKVNLSDLEIIRRTKDGGLVKLERNGTRTALFPERLKVKGSPTAGDVWKQVGVSARKTKKDKAATTLGVHQFILIVPYASASEAAARTVTAASNFEDIEEHGAALVAASETYRKTPDYVSIRNYFVTTLQEGYDKFEAGGPYIDYLNCVKYAQFAQAAMTGEPSLLQLAAQIVSKRDWIEENTRMLQSLINNGNWDSFLDRYLQFEKYQRSFPALMDAHGRAYGESARFHATAGRTLLEQKKFQDAVDELQLAKGRDPDNQQLADLLERARLAAADEKANERKSLIKPLERGSPEARLFEQRLTNASLYIKERKFKEAETALGSAEELDRNSPKILLVRAAYFEGTGQLAKAMEVLNAYDTTASTTVEKEEGDKVRNVVAHTLESLKADHRAKIDDLLKAGRYWEAQLLVTQSLELDPADEDFLYRAGVISAVLRKKEAIPTLQKYLQRSNSLHGDAKIRERAAKLVDLLQTPRAAAAPSGKPNWFSGTVLPPGIFYCPVSLTFQPRIAAVRSHKMTMNMEWSPDGKLQQIKTSFDDPKGEAEYLQRMGRRGGRPATVQSANLAFGYEDGSPQVYRVAEGMALAAPAPGPAAINRNAAGEMTFNGEGVKPGGVWQYPVLLNHPMIDPDVVNFLESPVTVGVAGNSYFNPFIWDGLHVFRFQYDKLGRVETAREVGVPNLVRFEWRNDQLISLTAFDVHDPKAERTVYKRSMVYDASGLLQSENVEYAKKSYKIQYRYQGRTLAEASFNDNGAHDGFEHKVKFLP